MCDDRFASHTGQGLVEELVALLDIFGWWTVDEGVREDEYLLGD